MSVFRESVAQRQVAKLYGTINLALPVRWRSIVLILLSMALVITLFLAGATHARTETAQGSVVPDTGILQIMPTRAGRVDTVAVVEGQMIRKDQTLAAVRVEEVDRDGAGAQFAVLEAITRQQTNLSRQEGLTRKASASEQNQYTAQVTGLRAELQAIDAQRATQRTLVTMAEMELARTREVAARGFISRRDLSVREETLIARQQQLLLLDQGRAAKFASMAAMLASAREAGARALALGASIARDQAQADRDQAVARLQQGYVLVAPEDGRVAALSIHPGDAVTPGDAVMMIVPRNGRLLARFYLPVKASGFVQAGQSVRLAIDAYPFDRFGTIAGVVSSVSTAPLMRKEATGSEAPYYVATATIGDPFVAAYGLRRPLLPGMTFSARVTTERRTLLQWLFDPIYAAVRQ